ncbi:hypothetical protein YC2023_106697 [Brassica napus]
MLFMIRMRMEDAESSGIIECSDNYFVADHGSLRQELNGQVMIEEQKEPRGESGKDPSTATSRWRCSWR